MGEIAEALRRAREQRQRSGATAPAAPRRPVEPSRPLPPVEVPPAAAPPREAGGSAATGPAFELGPTAELSRNLAIRVQKELDARDARSVAIVSAVQGEGKTTVACDLALALASLSRERDIALVDLDLRRPSLASRLGIAPSRGIEEVLRGGAALAEVCVSATSPLIDVYPMHTAQRTAHELLVSPHCQEMIRNLERRYRLVVVDTPPALMLPDASLILRSVATCIPVARAGYTRARLFRRLVEALPRERVVGELLNAVLSPGYEYDYDYGRAIEVRPS